MSLGKGRKDTDSRVANTNPAKMWNQREIYDDGIWILLDEKFRVFTERLKEERKFIIKKESVWLQVVREDI